MPKVKRWEFDINNQNPYGDPIYEDDNGDFVLFASYEKLQKEHELKLVELREAKDKIKALII